MFHMGAVPTLCRRCVVALLRCAAVDLPLRCSGIVGQEHSRGGVPAVWSLFYRPPFLEGGVASTDARQGLLILKELPKPSREHDR